MNPKLVERLMAAHPMFFYAVNQKEGDASSCKTIRCGNGWRMLIDTLCATLQFAADRGDGPQPVATRVKEFAGYLSVQLRHASEYQQGMIDMAGDFSTKLCDACGSPGRRHVLPGKNGFAFRGMEWFESVATRCARHKQKGHDIGQFPIRRVTQNTLTSMLIKAYPDIFYNPQLLNCGIECGPGWFPLIDTLCHCLTLDARMRGGVPPPVSQAKEKLGSLRFHMFNTTERQRGMIAFAIAMSEHICEVCGHPGTNQSTPTGFATRCARHHGA